jgi:hypothetical protein
VRFILCRYFDFILPSTQVNQYWNSFLHAFLVWLKIFIPNFLEKKYLGSFITNQAIGFDE